MHLIQSFGKPKEKDIILYLREGGKDQTGKQPGCSEKCNLGKIASQFISLAVNHLDNARLDSADYR